VIQAFEKYKTPLHMGVELPTLQAIKRFVALGNGVAFLPEISVEDENCPWRPGAHFRAGTERGTASYA